MPRRLYGYITPNNTTVDVEGYTITVTLRHTTVVRVDGPTVTLNSGRWQTVTTKRRMNEASRAFDLGFAVWQEDFEWFVTLPTGEEVPFYDGMTFPRSNHKEYQP